MIDKGEAARKLALTTARVSGLASIARRVVGRVGAIMMLHRVTRSPVSPLGVNRHLAICPDFLDALLCEMRRLGYGFVSMDELVEHLRRGGGGAPIAAFTADDGYRDNVIEALPVLESHAAPLAIYVSPGLTDGRVDLWWDVLEAIIADSDRLELDSPWGRFSVDCGTPARKVDANRRIHDHLTRIVPEEEQAGVLRRLARSVGYDARRPGRETLMGWDELAEAARHPLVTIGAHSLHHYNLRRLEEAKTRDELMSSAAEIERRLGARPRHLAYPYGYRQAVGSREVRLAAEVGFASAVTTRHGMLRASHAAHLHALPRISVNGRYQSVAHMRTMLSGVTTPLANAGRLTVTV